MEFRCGSGDGVLLGWFSEIAVGQIRRGVCDGEEGEGEFVFGGREQGV